MNPKDRKKMCTSCDGRIPYDADVCPYCTSSQKSTIAPVNQVKELHHQSLQDSLTSLYSPPYSGKMNPPAEKKEIPNINKFESLKEPMAEKRFNNFNSGLGIPTIPMQAAEEEHASDDRTSFWPILLLSIGANLLTLGLIQLFFSDAGFLRLEWNSSYWFVYCLAALPLFFFGFRKANAMKH